MRLTITRQGRKGFHVLHDRSSDGVFIDTQEEFTADDLAELLVGIADAVDSKGRRLDAAEHQRPAHKAWRERLEEVAPA